MSNPILPKQLEMSRKNIVVLKAMSYISACLVVVLLVAGSLAAQHAQLQRRVTILTVLAQNIPLLAENAMMGRRESFDNLALARGKLAATLDEVKRADPISSALGNPQFQVLSERTKWDALLVQSLDVLKVRRTTEELQQARMVVRERNTQLLKSIDILSNQAGSAWAKSFEPLKLQFRLQVPALEGDLAGMAEGKLTERETQLLVDKRLQFMNDVVTHLSGENLGLGVSAVPFNAQPALRQVNTMLQAVEGQVQAIIPLGTGLAAAHLAKEAVMETGLSLSASMRSVEQAGDQSVLQVFSRPWLLMALLSGTILMLVGSILTQRMLASSRGAAEKRQEQNERNQRAIVRLLGEIENLAKGDLTVQATVNEDITGAIADSINYTISALRRLVLTIQQSATQMDSSVRKTQLVSLHLSESAALQAKQVASASASAVAVAASTRHVSGNAERSAEVASQSVELAHRGGEAVRRTIEGMNAIRENIQETSKRIKRLGESSQEIGNIVELINDIADQTNVLALNASIQASAAGEAGRGFAVVADEVQRLAERAARATRQIDMLVRGIQADTGEAVVSMERTTTDVVGGALLAENAGHALDEIEQVSTQISSLVQGISLSAQEQASASQNIAQNMRSLHDISTETMRSVTDTTASITHLTDLAGTLHKSVAEFKVPTVETGKDPGNESKQPLRFRSTKPKDAPSNPDVDSGGTLS